MKPVLHIQPFVLVLGLLVPGVFLPASVQAQQVTLRAHVVSAGAGPASSTTYRLQSTVAPPSVGIASSDAHVARFGFWPQVHPPAVPLAVPALAADAVTTDEDVAVTVRVLDNDTDPAGGALSIASVTQPDTGSVAMSGDTLLTYTPPPDFNGQDSFTYTATNEQGGSATATVTVTILPVNDAPAFISEPVTGVAAGEAYTYTAVATDVDGDALALSARTLPAWLGFSDDGDGTATLTGTPTRAEVGEHEVSLRVDDGTEIVEQTFVVTVSQTAPSAPLLVGPEDGVEDVAPPVTLEWQAAAGASSYDVQVATAEDFSAIVHDTTGVTSTTLPLDGLSAGTTHFWRVRGVNGAGASSFTTPHRFTTATDVAAEDEAVPTAFALRQNYPNPFNPSTTIVFETPMASHVRLVVFDVYGRTVTTLADERRPAGRHEVHFEASRLASGLYLYRLEADDFTATRSMVLAK